MRFFGLRPRHHGPGRRSHSRLSIRMSRVFHRPSMMARRRTTTTSASARREPVSTSTPAATNSGSSTTTAVAPRNRQASMLFIPENEPVSLDWGLSSSNSMDLGKSVSRSTSLVRHEDIENRLLVQRLILEELQSKGRKSSVTRDSRSTMMKRAQALSMAFLEGRGSEMIPRHMVTYDEEGAAGAAQQLTHKEEKKLRKSVARAIRSEEKKLKKLDKLNKKRAKQYARAEEFFGQTTNVVLDISHFRNSSNSISRQSDSYHFDMEAAESKWHQQRSSESESEFLSSSLTQYSRRDSNGSTSSLSRSRGKPPRMEFLFFGGSADDYNLNCLEIGHHRFEPDTTTITSNTAEQDFQKDSSLITIKANPTLVRNMPRPFNPRMEVYI